MFRRRSKSPRRFARNQVAEVKLVRVYPKTREVVVELVERNGDKTPIRLLEGDAVAIMADIAAELLP